MNDDSLRNCSKCGTFEWVFINAKVCHRPGFAENRLGIKISNIPCSVAQDD